MTAGGLLDDVEHLTNRVVCRSVVFERLAELLAANERNGSIVCDFGSIHESEFWWGLRDMAVQTIEDQKVIARTVTTFLEQHQ